MNRDELLQQLVELDEQNFLVSGGGSKGRMIIVGGAAFIINNLTSRAITRDIDYVAIEDIYVYGALSDAPLFDGQCGAFVLCLPYNFEDRLRHIELETRSIDFFTPSPEDLAVMKLYRYEESDKQDLASVGFLEVVDWDLLDDLVYSADEAAASRISDEANDTDLKWMRETYARYKCEFK